jgi:hypothetical protein
LFAAFNYSITKFPNYSTASQIEKAAISGRPFPACGLLAAKWFRQT